MPFWNFGGYTDLNKRSFDEPCSRCGTIIAYSKGIGDCPRCSGLSAEQQIELHKQQAQEYQSRKRMGYGFAAASLLMVALLIWMIFG